ncbi:MAG: Fe-S cluster assembly protein SufD [Alphaproteobacteria bacterium]
MSVRKHTSNVYVDRFNEVRERLPGTALPWLTRLRSNAIEHFADCGFPTPRVEEWKYTNLSRIVDSQPILAGPSVNGVNRGALEQYFLDPMPCHRMVFVNGYFRPDLSEIGVLPAGLTISTLETTLANRPELLEAHWSDLCDLAEDRLSGKSDPKPLAMVALNTAFAADGAVIHLDRDVSPDGPIHLIYVAVREGERPAMSHPRSLVVAESGAHATIFETFIGDGGSAHCSNALTQVSAGPGARICHYKHQGEAPRGTHIGSSHIRLARDSTYNGFVLSNGAHTSRNEIRVRLEEENVGCFLDGIYLARAQQRMDNWTRIDHMAPCGKTREVYKGVIDEAARGSFQGKIRVWPNAIQSDARQLNRNLLLSEHAEAASKPELEILNDEVQCAHGSTIGDLDEESLFYLRARGVGEAAARRLLIDAFVGELIDKVADVPIRKYFRNLFNSWLSEAV